VLVFRLFSKIDEPASLPRSVRRRIDGAGVHAALTTDVLAKLWFTVPRLVRRLAGLFLCNLVLEENVMARSNDAPQQSATAAVKAERALDKAAAMREYEAEQVALRANTARLRALRLAKEAEINAAPAMKPPAKKKAVAREPVSKRAAAKPPALA
jgi:hypothetical protein